MALRTFEEYVAAAAEKRQMSEYVLGSKGLKIYVRCGIQVPGFELANIWVSEAWRGQGRFTRFLEKWEPKVPLFVENVHNVRLAEFLERREGWHRTGSYRDIGAPSYMSERWKVMLPPRFRDFE